MTTKDWMSRIPDQNSTTNVSLPGTHETMSLYGGPPKMCQTMSLIQQYEAGIRFVDIRCRHFNVFMRVKEEYKPENNTQTFARTVQCFVDRYPAGRFYHGEGYPTLGEARGKLVILRDYEGPASFGLAYGDLDIEDLWQVPSLLPENINRKWDATRSQLEKARQGPASTIMYLTYSSGTSAFAFPEAVAERLNKCLLDFLNRKAKARWGMIAMDFPDAKLIDEIINSNF